MDKGRIHRHLFRFISRGYPYTLYESNILGEIPARIVSNIFILTGMSDGMEMERSARPQVEQGWGRQEVSICQTTLSFERYPALPAWPTRNKRKEVRASFCWLLFYWRRITSFITKPSPNHKNSWVKIYQQFLLRDYFRTTFNYSSVFCILLNKETIWKFVICDRNKNTVYWAEQCLRQIWIGKVPQEIRAIQVLIQIWTNGKVWLSELVVK